MPFKYPYTNYQELNLDWILSEVKKVSNFDDRLTKVENQSILNDDELNSIKAVIAEDFDDLSSYGIGAYVWHDDKLYRFKTTHLWGSWNASEVTLVLTMDEIRFGFLTIAPRFDPATENEIDSYVYEGAALYKLPAGHTAGQAWEYTPHTFVQIGTELEALYANDNTIASEINTIESDVSYLKSQIKDSKAVENKLSDSPYEKTTRTLTTTAGGWVLKGDGYCVSVAGYTMLKFTVTAGELLYITNTDMVGTSYATFQFQNSASVPASGVKTIVGQPYFDTAITVVVPDGATYLIVSVNNSLQNVGVYTLTPYKESVNLFNKNDVVQGYLTGAGVVYNPSGTGPLYRTTQFIDISEYKKLSFSMTNIACWYDSSKTFMSMVSGMDSVALDKTSVVPTGAKYIRVTGLTADIDVIQFGYGITRDNYIPHSSFTMRNEYITSDRVLDVNEDTINIALDGSGDYDSITEALYNNISKELTVYVHPGVYDIISEYKTFFGAETFETMGNSSPLNGFQNGVVLRNKKIIFLPGSYVICDWTNSGHDSGVESNFSPFRVDYNVEVEGLYLTCDGSLYGIHDDYGISTPYTIKYKNCVVIGSNLRGANCIGGGCKKYSRHVLENCYFTNGMTAESDLVLSCCVRYHNTNADGAVPEVYVSNCYFETNFNACYYGSQVSKMRVYVNNCFAPKGINKRQESSSYSVDNIDLFTWNNQTT